MDYFEMWKEAEAEMKHYFEMWKKAKIETKHYENECQILRGELSHIRKGLASLAKRNEEVRELLYSKDK